MVSFLALSLCSMLLLTPQWVKVFRVPAFRENPIFVLHLGCALGSTFCPPVPGEVTKTHKESRFCQNFPGQVLALALPGFLVSLHFGGWHILYFYRSLMFKKNFLRFLFWYLDYFIWLGCSLYPICYVAGKRDFPQQIIFFSRLFLAYVSQLSMLQL